jgi:hypothetical protein
MRLDLEPQDWVDVVNALMYMAQNEAGQSQAPYLFKKEDTDEWALALKIKAKLEKAHDLRT